MWSNLLHSELLPVGALLCHLFCAEKARMAGSAVLVHCFCGIRCVTVVAFDSACLCYCHMNTLLGMHSWDVALLLVVLSLGLGMES